MLNNSTAKDENPKVTLLNFWKPLHQFHFLLVR